MTTTLLTNIGLLVTNDPEHADGDGSPLGVVRKGALVVDGANVVWAGRAGHAPHADRLEDFQGRTVVPGFVDSHTHLIFAGERAAEFVARMSGSAYEAGGIMATVTATRAAGDGQLALNARRLLAEMVAGGTTTVEVKSGYGLTVEDESRCLWVARQLTTETTYLGAHVVPREYAKRRDTYVELVCGEMLAACAPKARWIDVFCDRGAFDLGETRAIVQAGAAAGLLPRLHANQLQQFGAIQLGVELGAASVDHCNELEEADVEALAASDTVATLLPAADFATKARYADGRRLIDAGVSVAIATDCNPGTSYTTSMALCIALAVREMRLTPEEAIWSATAGGARALRREDVGVLRPGARADLAVIDAPSYLHLAYRPGVPLVVQTWQAGLPVTKGSE